MKKKNVLKGITIGFTLILFSFIAMYLGLSKYYGEGFSYGTWINGIYCTGKSINEVNGELLKQCDYEGLTIVDGDGKSYTILPDEVGLTYSYKEALDLFLEKQNPYLWIDNLLSTNKYKELAPVVHYDKAAYQQKIEGLPFFTGREDSKRRIAIEKGSEGYYLVNERVHVMDQTLAKQMILEAFEAFQTEINLEEAGCYRDLELDREMEETLNLWNKLSAYQDCKIVYLFGEEQVPVDAGVVCNFLLLDENGGFMYDENGQLCTDEKKVFEYVDALADEYDTVGGTRYFQATRGDIVAVEGGIYGNKIDRKAEKSYLLEAFLRGANEQHTPEYQQMARKQGKNDIGDTYIEVDMTNQMMYYYRDGVLEIETPVVTGNTSLRRGTPCGTNYVYAKQTNRVLRGPGYASPVKFWIPVKGGIGIHDASWRSEYGEEIYKTNGSHGCINTPYDKVAKLYEMVEIGTPCVMFY